MRNYVGLTDGVTTMATKTLYNQATAAPTEKVKAAFAWGKLATVALGLVAVFYPEAYAKIPQGFEVALGGLLASLAADIAGYMKRERV